MVEKPTEKKKVIVEETGNEPTEIINTSLELEADDERPGVGYEILSIGTNGTNP